ncbi:hypothetical protein ACWA7J_16060 [Leptothrix sp. BB-4]
MTLGIDPVNRVAPARPAEPARPRSETGERPPGAPVRRPVPHPAASAPPEVDRVDVAVLAERGGGDDALLPFPAALVTPTHYARLGVTETASAAEIAAAWQRLRPPGSDAEGHTALRAATLNALPWPQGSALETPQVRARQRELAHDVLSDPVRRAVYDRWLAEHRHTLTSAAGSSGWVAWMHSARVHKGVSIVVGLTAIAVLAWLLG